MILIYPPKMQKRYIDSEEKVQYSTGIEYVLFY